MRPEQDDAQEIQIRARRRISIANLALIPLGIAGLAISCSLAYPVLLLPILYLRSMMEPDGSFQPDFSTSPKRSSE